MDPCTIFLFLTLLHGINASSDPCETVTAASLTGETFEITSYSSVAQTMYDYTVTVGPGGSLEQEETSGSGHWTLGYHASFNGMEETFDNGDFCPPINAPRRAKITYSFGPSTEIVSSSEPETCYYEFHIQIEQTVCEEITTTKQPSFSPTTTKPTENPSFKPTTSSPTRVPSFSPTTTKPTENPSLQPTTESPTNVPSKSPTTENPTTKPSFSYPSSMPSTQPSVTPSTSPSNSPTSTSPSSKPSVEPTQFPSVDACVSDIWVAVEDCMTDELCQGICTGTPELCPPKACECLEEFEEKPGFCCGGSCHDDFDELWTFNYHNAFWNSYDNGEPVQWDLTTEGCRKLCHSFDRCDAFTVVDNVKCELISGFDHFEPSMDCESCFVKSHLPTSNDGQCFDDDITVVNINLGGFQDGPYVLANGIWMNDHPLKLHCCEETGVWGVTKIGDTCISSYDEYTWNVGSCCVSDLIDHLAFFTTTAQPSNTPSASPTLPSMNECMCNLVEMSGLESHQSQRNGIYLKEVGLYHDDWPVYKSTHHVEAPEQYLYYWAPSAEWIIGSDYESPLGYVVSNNNEAIGDNHVGCPYEFDVWTTVNFEGGFDSAPNGQASCFTPPPMA